MRLLYVLFSNLIIAVSHADSNELKDLSKYNKFIFTYMYGRINF